MYFDFLDPENKLKKYELENFFPSKSFKNMDLVFPRGTHEKWI